MCIDMYGSRSRLVCWRSWYFMICGSLWQSVAVGARCSTCQMSPRRGWQTLRTGFVTRLAVGIAWDSTLASACLGMPRLSAIAHYHHYHSFLHLELGWSAPGNCECHTIWFLWCIHHATLWDLMIWSAERTKIPSEIEEADLQEEELLAARGF